MPIETRAVLGGAYRGGLRARVLLTHAVVVSAQGNPRRVLCGKIKIESLADVMADDPRKPPTCVRCFARLQKLRTEDDE